MPTTRIPRNETRIAAFLFITPPFLIDRRNYLLHDYSSDERRRGGTVNSPSISRRTPEVLELNSPLLQLAVQKVSFPLPHQRKCFFALVTFRPRDLSAPLVLAQISFCASGLDARKLRFPLVGRSGKSHFANRAKRSRKPQFPEPNGVALPPRRSSVLCQ